MVETKRFTEKDRILFTKNADDLALFLLGKILCHNIDGTVLKFLITETEAYGKDDPFCHSKNYKTGNGVEVQKMQGGTIYVHNRTTNEPGSMFDIVSGKKGEGEGVLIRGGMDVKKLELIEGPRKLGYAIRMIYENNKKDLLNSKNIWLEEIPSIIISENNIIKKPRIGLSIPESDSTEKKSEKEKHIRDELNFSICKCEINRLKNICM